MFTFDKRSQRYRNTITGKFISRSQIADLVENQIARIKTDVRAVTDRLLNNDINVKEWELSVARSLKAGHTISYLLGKGGMYNLHTGDYNIIAQRSRTEFAFLRNFSNQILRGELSKAQIHDRVTKYTDAFYGSYEKGRSQGHKEAGFNWEKRYTTPGEICADCAGYAAMGWRLIGTLPAIGQGSRCGSRCRCEFGYSRENPEEKQAVHSLRTRYGSDLLVSLRLKDFST